MTNLTLCHSVLLLFILSAGRSSSFSAVICSYILSIVLAPWLCTVLSFFSFIYDFSARKSMCSSFIFFDGIFVLFGFTFSSSRTLVKLKGFHRHNLSNEKNVLSLGRKWVECCLHISWNWTQRFRSVLLLHLNHSSTVGHESIYII